MFFVRSNVALYIRQCHDHLLGVVSLKVATASASCERALHFCQKSNIAQYGSVVTSCPAYVSPMVVTCKRILQAQAARALTQKLNRKCKGRVTTSDLQEQATSASRKGGVHYA